MKKKIISLLTTLVMVVGLIGVMPVVSAGAAGTSIETLKKQYPAGSKWTGSYDGASQCHGWALMIADKAYGYSSTSSNRCRKRTRLYDVNRIKAGDVVRVYRSSSHSDSYAHTFFVTSVSGNNITFADCNWDWKGSIRWNVTKTKSSLTNGTYGYGLQYILSAPYELGGHTHSYTKGVESAHPHRVYMKCSCGKSYYTGATTISTSCSTCMKKSTKYPTPIKAYTLATGKTTVYTSINGKAKANKIYDTDLCTINKIYENGWCKVTFPLTSGKTDSGYVKTSVFFNSSYNVTTSKTAKKITTYARSNLSKSIGYAGSGDKVYIIGHTSKAVQIVYPLTAGGYKAGWVPISAFTYTLKYNANGGSGSMSNASVKYQNSFKLSQNTFKRKGYTFAGWNVYRSSDKKWYVSGKGWYTASEIKSKKYTKKLYANASKYNLNQSWINSAKTNDTYTFYAVWKKNS